LNETAPLRISATESRVVATGRLMKGAEMFIAALTLSPKQITRG